MNSFRKSLTNPFCLALDMKSWEGALRLLSRLTPKPAIVKIGPLLYLRESGRIEEWFIRTDQPVFLDFKWHDIPNTVAGSVEAIPGSCVKLLTVHAQGGKKMIRAARDAADSRDASGKGRPLVLAVTVLTHLDGPQLAELGIQGRQDAVRRLGTLALESGADGLVMSPGDLAMARKEWGREPLVVTPGIRFPERNRVQNDDQILAESPENALQKGSDLLVVGRPILESPDPPTSWSRLLFSWTPPPET
ncbi:orotidine-5'-phosphate decarboxylase [Leptospirillum ferriphilum]|uniref:orotidine-5'-phosphate decarboxylase n=1 Tax=Leptospirillum ferriphilum TaxID=178606 RepID=UPI0021189D0C|nr:orotidine-5'-phosphate decarboxylase [Leptospirillum ferriphilum]